MPRSMHLFAWLSVAIGSVALLGVGAALAQQPAPANAPDGRALLDEAVSVRGEANAALTASQELIEELSDETDALLTRYQAALRQHESLRSYNDQLRQLIRSQEVERASLEEQTGQVELVSREVTPLMLRMIGALESFVSLDVPFLKEERTQRILDLRKLMRRADVTEAEKFRRIMEAYQIENEYGRTIEAYRSTLQQGDKEVTVNFLRVGRIALVYQTLNEAEAGVWNQAERRWDPVESSLRSSIRAGLRIARKQSAPDLIRLPLPRPEQGEG